MTPTCRLLSMLAAVVMLLSASPLPAAEHEEKLVWHLLTMGPASDLFSLWGHSALCVSTGDYRRGQCYDFGIAREENPAKLALGTLRGDRMFTALKLPAGFILAQSRFRDTLRQRIELDQVSARALLAELEATVAKKQGYAYQPLFRNCTTEIRDRLDIALGGRLSRGGNERSGPPLRQVAEKGLSGQVLPLALIALAGGSRMDRPSTSWERMGLPDGLMEALAARLSAAPGRVWTRKDAPPPTSPAAGRVVVLLLTAASSLAFWLLRRRSPQRAGFLERSASAWLGSVSLVPLAGMLSTLPSLQHNWTMLVLVPLDFILLGKAARWHERYVLLRLLSVLGLGLAAQARLIDGALWTGVVVAGAPLGLWLWSRRRSLAPQATSVDLGLAPTASRHA
jgi:hypothetical protein